MEVTRAEHGKDFVWRIIKCAWCDKTLYRVRDYGQEYDADYESHGICEKCDRIHFGHVKP